MKTLRVIGANGVVLGVFKVAAELDAWRQCCKSILSPQEWKDAQPITAVAPGITFAEVKVSDFKPTHVIHHNDRTIPVVCGESLGYPNLEIFYTQQEWLEQSGSSWERVDGKKIRFKGQEKAYAEIREMKG